MFLTHIHTVKALDNIFLHSNSLTDVKTGRCSAQGEKIKPEHLAEAIDTEVWIKEVREDKVIWCVIEHCTTH